MRFDARRSLLPSLGSTCLLALALSLAASGCDGEEKDGRIKELEAEVATQTEAAEAAQAALDSVGKTKQEALDEAQATIDGLEGDVANQAAKVGELDAEKGELEGQLEQTELALQSMESLQKALSESLVEEIETGEIRVAKRGGFLVVNVSDKVLFAKGEAVLSERGQQVITRLATSLQGLPGDTVFQVGGHTDNQAIKSEEVLANFPTNWELSTARATNVVRFMEEHTKLPGKRLVAAGFSSFRPVASNKKPKGRAKNRRIEIALLPPRK